MKHVKYTLLTLLLSASLWGQQVFTIQRLYVPGKIVRIETSWYHPRPDRVDGYKIIENSKIDTVYNTVFRSSPLVDLPDTNYFNITAYNEFGLSPDFEYIIVLVPDTADVDTVTGGDIPFYANAHDIEDDWEKSGASSMNEFKRWCFWSFDNEVLVFKIIEFPMATEYMFKLSGKQWGGTFHLKINNISYEIPFTTKLDTVAMALNVPAGINKITLLSKFDPTELGFISIYREASTPPVSVSNIKHEIIIE